METLSPIGVADAVGEGVELVAIGSPLAWVFGGEGKAATIRLQPRLDRVERILDAVSLVTCPAPMPVPVPM